MDSKVKQEAIQEFRINESDTGSADVQVAVLSRRIKHLERIGGKTESCNWRGRR